MVHFANKVKCPESMEEKCRSEDMPFRFQFLSWNGGQQSHLRTRCQQKSRCEVGALPPPLGESDRPLRWAGVSDQEAELFTISMVSCVPERLENRIREYTLHTGFFLLAMLLRFQTWDRWLRCPFDIATQIWPPGSPYIPQSLPDTEPFCLVYPSPLS